MRLGRLVSGVAAVMAIVVLTGCEGVGAGPVLGGRPITISVHNGSPRPALLLIARDEMPIQRRVGTANPDSVPPGATIDVTFVIQDESHPWAIFVNPGPSGGALVTSADVPQAFSGKAPVQIDVGLDGQPSVSVPGNAKGWFGN
jgi:hypothetical protein